MRKEEREREGERSRHYVKCQLSSLEDSDFSAKMENLRTLYSRKEMAVVKTAFLSQYMQCPPEQLLAWNLALQESLLFPINCEGRRIYHDNHHLGPLQHARSSPPAQPWGGKYLPQGSIDTGQR